MTIKCDNFYLPEEKKLPVRTTKQFHKWRRETKTDTYAPIPIKYDHADQKFDPENPVWYSLRQFVEYVRGVPGWYPFNSSEKMDKGKWEGDSWDWGFNLNSALKLFDDGWTEGVEAVRWGMEKSAEAAMLAAMKDIAPARDMHGSFIDVDSYLKGEPDCMFEFQETVQPILHLEVEVDSFVVCSTDADEVMYRGVAIMAAVMALRRLGVMVSLYQREICYTGTPDSGPKPVTATVHLMNQDLTENMSDVLLALAHPGFHRRVYFQAVAAAWGCDNSGLSWQRRNTQDFTPKAGSGKICIPGHFRETFGDDDNTVDWGESWASPKAAEGLVQIMLQAAAPR